MRWAWVLGAVIAGCRSFDAVDDACKGHLRGQRHGSPEAVQFFGRVTCYRRYAGLGQANLQRDVNEAAEAHAAYLEENGIDEEWPLERLGDPGFTGVDSFARIEAAGRLLDRQGTFVWEVLAPVDTAVLRDRVVDAYMHDPLVRDVLLAPGWVGGGYGELDGGALGPFAYFHAVLTFPSGASANRPIEYPVDGQTGVPVSVSGLVDLPGAPGVAGYPISVTFGSNEVLPASPNPLGVGVFGSTITGPDGPVEHLVFLPGPYESGTNWSTAILLPTTVLQAHTTYEVVATVGWVTDAERELVFSFTTGSEGVAAPF